jgi:hypothetical protein
VTTTAGALFVAVALGTLILVPAYAWRRRGRTYALFGLVILMLSLPGAITTHARLLEWLPAGLAPWLDALFLYGMVAAAMHLLALVTPRLRSPVFRLGVSIPGMTFIAAGALSGLWLLVLLPARTLCWALGWTGALAALRGLDALPLLIALASIATSARPRREIVPPRSPGFPSNATAAGHHTPFPTGPCGSSRSPTRTSARGNRSTDCTGRSRSCSPTSQTSSC